MVLRVAIRFEGCVWGKGLHEISLLYEINLLTLRHNFASLYQWSDAGPLHMFYDTGRKSRTLTPAIKCGV